MSRIGLRSYSVHTQDRFASLRMALVNGINQSQALTPLLYIFSTPAESTELYAALKPLPEPEKTEPAPAQGGSTTNTTPTTTPPAEGTTTGSTTEPAPEPEPEELKFEYFSDYLYLGPRVSRVSDIVVRGANGPEAEYRIEQLFDWKPVSEASDIPVLEDYGYTIEFRVKLQYQGKDEEGEQLPQQKFYGVSVTITEADQFDTVVTPPVDLNITVPVNWSEPSRTHRALAFGKLVPRHPDMSIGMGGVVAYGVTGNRVYPQRRGELLCFPDQGPFLCYWTPGSGEMPLPNISESSYQASYTGIGRGSWGAAETFQESRNVVLPEFQLTIGGMDFTSHIVDFQPGSVTIAGPASVFENLVAAVQIVQVSNNVQPVFTGRAVRVDTKPYANGRVVTFQVMPNTEFFDVDLSRVNLEGETLPPSEASYVIQTLNSSGFRGTLQVAPGIRWRDTAFWQAAIPAGPGMELAEVESRYQNTQNTSTLASIKMVAQANMLDLYDLPGGDIMVDTIIPSPEKSLQDLLKNASAVYCMSSGRYINDPRVNISQVSLALDEGFTQTEIEGFSNEVNPGISKGWANFVQNYKNNNFLELTVGGYESGRDFPLIPFEVMQNNALKGEFYPVEWFSEVQLTADGSAIEAERTYQSAGFAWSFGNKSVTDKQLIIMSGTQLVNKWPDRKADIQAFVDQFMPPLEEEGGSKYATPEGRMENSRMAVGISTSIWGDAVSKAIFQFRVNVGKPSEANLSVVPLVGKFDQRWAPEWFPPGYVNSLLEILRDLKPRGVRKISNPMIARIGGQYAVQKPNFPDGRVKDSDYDNNWNTSANQLATWLTIKDLLKTRKVELSLAGAQPVLPNQFIFIARRPPQGPGAPVTHIDALLTLEPGKPDARVGSEAWTRISCAYVGTIANNEVTYDMPLGWGVTWEESND